MQLTCGDLGRQACPAVYGLGAPAGKCSHQVWTVPSREQDTSLYTHVTGCTSAVGLPVDPLDSEKWYGSERTIKGI